jgi:hypothetical protein
MINNVLKGGEVALETPLLKDTAHEQTVLINTLLLVCLVCVPTMLFVKPWILIKR